MGRTSAERLVVLLLRVDDEAALGVAELDAARALVAEGAVAGATRSVVTVG